MKNQSTIKQKTHVKKKLNFSISLNNISSKTESNHIIKKKKIEHHKKNTPPSKISSKCFKINGNISVTLNIEPGDNFTFISHEQTYLTHGLHKYPAKFFPELPKWLIQKYSKKGDIILDPFMGSGTTNIESLMLGRNSIGIDIDPFARFLSRIKTTKLDLKKLQEAQKDIFQLLPKYDYKNINKEDIPKFPYMEHWFKINVAKELTYIKSIILNLKTTKNIKNFYLLCFSSIIRKVSNASNECTRTVIRKKYINPIEPLGTLECFYNAVVSNILKYQDFHELYPSDITAKFPVNWDARNIKLTKNSIDMALTSPPYINAVDYPRTHQLELYWLGLCSSSLVNLKKQYVGTENVYFKDYKELKSTGIDVLDKKLSIVFKKNPRRSYIAYKYFSDMRANLEEVYRVLKIGGKYAIVVGNNHICNEVFENWRYLLAIAKQVGFYEETYFSSEIIRHFMRFNKEDKIKQDWIIILRK